MMSNFDAKIKGYIESGLTLESVIRYFEDNYYQKITDACSFDVLSKSIAFFTSTSKHLSLYTDHGVVHVRNIACMAVELCETLHHLNYYHKTDSSLHFMRSYLIFLTYLHDAGMCVFTGLGRATHAEYMAQETYKPHFDFVIDHIMSSNVGQMVDQVSLIKHRAKVSQDERVIMRELLAMSCCHSKTTVSHALLNNRSQLRASMLGILTSPLELIYYQKLLKSEKNTFVRRYGALRQAAGSSDPGVINSLALMAGYRKKIREIKKTGSTNPDLDRFYTDVHQQAFSWLDCQETTVKRSVDDIIDCLRVLRAADALRQRGTTLKTSANYQMIVDYQTADVIYVLPLKDGRNYLLSLADNPINAGEANLASTEFTPDGSLCFSFYNGLFGSVLAQSKAEKQAALIINDIQDDVLGSLKRPNKKNRILIEQPWDNPDFASGVRKNLLEGGTKMYGSIDIIPSLRNCSSQERRRYLLGKPVDHWSARKKQQILKNIGKTGYRVDCMSHEDAFKYARLVDIHENETVFEASMESEFAYFALDSGLTGEAVGGYGGFELPKWSLFGHISLIRNAERNATVRATHAVRAVMLPRVTFMNYWRYSYTIDELKALLYTKNNEGSDPSAKGDKE